MGPIIHLIPGADYLVSHIFLCSDLPGLGRHVSLADCPRCLLVSGSQGDKNIYNHLKIISSLSRLTTVSSPRLDWLSWMDTKWLRATNQGKGKVLKKVFEMKISF